MDKQQALEYIKSLAASKVIDRQELVAAFDAGAGVSPALPATLPTESSKHGIADIIYYIGGAIVFAGICIFVWQNWDILPPLTRIAATLGGGIAAYIVGVIFGTQEKLQGPSNAFHFIGALVMPLGLYVVFDTFGLQWLGLTGQLTTSFLLFLMYIASVAVFRRPLFVLFSLIFGTWLFYALTNFLVAHSITFSTTSFFEYRSLVSGISYILLGYAFSEGKYSSLKGVLYGFGSLGVLSAALALGGWEPHKNAFWELAYPLLVFGVLYLSVYLKSKSFLTFGTIFLMVYILKITSEYFSKGFGWPLSLVIAGLLMIVVGYAAVSINKSYIRTA